MTSFWDQLNKKQENQSATSALDKFKKQQKEFYVQSPTNKNASVPLSSVTPKYIAPTNKAGYVPPLSFVPETNKTSTPAVVQSKTPSWVNSDTMKKINSFVSSLPEAPKNPVDGAKLIGEIAKSIAQGTARSGGTVTATFWDQEINAPEDTLAGKIQKTVFGDGPIKPLGDQSVDYAKELQEKGVNKYVAAPWGMLMAAGTVGLDFTGAGGEKNALRAIANASKIEDTVKIGKQIGIADDLLDDFASAAVKVKSEKTAKSLVDHFSNLQQETKSVLKNLGNTLESKNLSQNIGEQTGKIDDRTRDIQYNQTKNDSIDYAKKNESKLISDYEKKEGNFLGGDNIKELFPEYTKDSTKYLAYRDAGNSLWNKVFDKWLVEKRGTANNDVLILMGGPGTGKTVSAKSILGKNFTDKYSFVVEVTGHDKDLLNSTIKRINDNGFGVNLTQVYTDPKKAFSRTLSRAMDNAGKNDGKGRTVYIPEYVNRHLGSIDLGKEYAVKLGDQTGKNRYRLILNEGDLSNIKKLTPKEALDFWQKIGYNKSDSEKLVQQFYDEAIQNYKRRGISQNVFEGTTGISGTAEERVRARLRLDRGISQAGDKGQLADEIKNGDQNTIKTQADSGASEAGVRQSEPNIGEAGTRGENGKISQGNGTNKRRFGNKIKPAQQSEDFSNPANEAGFLLDKKTASKAVPSTRSQLEGVRLDQSQGLVQATKKIQLPETGIKLSKDISSTKSSILPQQALQLQKGTQLAPKLTQANRLSLPNKYNENLLKVKTSIKNIKTKVIEYIQDAETRVKDLGNIKGAKMEDFSNPYQKMTLYPGRVASKIETAKTEVEAIMKEANKVKVSRKEISDYLIARHAPERNAALGEKAAGITTEEANASLKVVEGSAKGKSIKELADRVQKLSNQTLDILKESGVISEDLYKTFRTKYKNHVPLNRIMDDTDDIGQALSGRGYNVRFSGIKKAVGSERKVADIMENVVLNYEQAVLRSEKNIVDQSTLAFTRENKDILKGLMEEVHPKAVGKTFDGKMIMEKTNDPTTLQMFENGKPVWIKIQDKNLAIALQGVGKWKIGPEFKAVAFFTKLYSSLATRFNPEFALPNKIRDLQETAVYLTAQNKIGFSGAAKAATRDSASVIDVTAALMGKNTPGAKLYNEMKAMGGTTGGFGLSTRTEVKLSLDKMEKLANSKVPVKKLANNFVQYIDNWNTIFEDSTRLSVYKTALDKGLSKERAAAMAKEASINFNRMGKGGPVVNALYMFSNASIQGSAKMIRSLNPLKHPKVFGATVLAVGGSVVAVNSFNDKADPDWRDKVSKWDRLNGLPVVVPSTDGTFRYVTIPVSWGIKPMKVMADYADDALSGKKFDAIEMVEKTMSAITDAYNPMGGTDFTSAIIPTILDLPVDIARNTQWSGSPIKPTLYDKNTPADIQYFSSLKDTETGKLAISLTEALQKNTGIAFSPASVKYAYDQTVGGAGRTVSKVANLISGTFSGKELPLDEYPMLSRFYRERTEEEIGQGAGGETEKIKKVLEGQSRERFNMKNEAENLYETIKNNPDKEERRRLLNEAIENNPAVVDKMNEIAKDEAKGLTYTDRLVKQLGVENGERARYIIEKMNSLKTKEEKGAYLDDLIKKGLMTKAVEKSILEEAKK
jgi:hypothetical protein